MRVTRERDEAGFTLTEVLIAMVITSIVAASIFGILISQTKAERRATDYTVNQEEIRQAMVYLQRDLRSAEPIVGVASLPDFAYQVDLNVYDSITSTTPTKISWRIDPTTNELRRVIIDASNNTTITYRLKGTVNRSLGLPLFQYYNDESPVPYDLALVGVITTADVAYCTVRVVIDLRAAPNGSPKPSRLVSDVMLRNKLPGAVQC